MLRAVWLPAPPEVERALGDILVTIKLGSHFILRTFNNNKKIRELSPVLELTRS